VEANNILEIMSCYMWFDTAHARFDIMTLLAAHVGFTMTMVAIAMVAGAQAFFNYQNSKRAGLAWWRQEKSFHAAIGSDVVSQASP